MADERGTPKAFLSYSWSSPEYAERVADLADQLRSHGIDLVFDQWDLREGQDLHSFMEQAVNDPTVSHVLILCDPAYAEKANDRRGGVGKETLIVSPNVYENVRQERVIPCVMERAADGAVKLPTYLETRRYIDFSIPDRQLEAYEQLLRTLYGKPSRERPPLGKPPAFLEDNYVPLRTTAASQLFRTALLSNRPQAAGLFADYLDRLGDAFANEELTEIPTTIEELEQNVLESIDRFLPYRDELADVCRLVARYSNDLTLADRIHEFLERIGSARFQHRQIRWSEDAETENLAFIAWELTLYIVAVFVREASFLMLGRLLAPLHIRSWQNSGALRSFAVLQPAFRLLDHRNDRLKLGKLDLAATSIHERAALPSLPFEALMEADLLLWYRVATATTLDDGWFPRTLIYLGYVQRLPLFERARDPMFFSRLAPALGVADRSQFVARFGELDESSYYQVGRSIGRRSAYARQLGIEEA